MQAKSMDWVWIVLRATDWCIALGLMWAFVGFEFGGSDDYSFLPWVYKLDNPGLFPGDIRFSTDPSRYYYFHIALLYWATKLLSVPYAFVVLNVASVALLLYAMRRLVRSLWSIDIPVAGITLLLLAYGNAHLVGGYYLYSRSFSTHYPAIGLTLLALSLTLERKFTLGAFATALALVLNPRLGLTSCLVILGVFTVRRMSGGTHLSRSPGIIGLSAAVAGTIALLVVQMTSSQGFDDIVRFWVYARSPGHYLPSYWDGYVLPNLVLVVIFVALLYRTRLVTKTLVPVYAVLVAMLLAIAVGIVNNQLMLSTSLVLANPLQFGPIVLALVYVFLIGILANRWPKYPFEVAMILILPTTQLRLLALIVMMLIWSREGDRTDSLDKRGLFLKSARGALMQATAVVLAMAVFPAGYSQIEPKYVLKLLLPGLLAAPVAILAYRPVGRMVERSVLAAAAFILTIVVIRGNVHGIRIDPGVEPEWVEVCAYVENNTEHGAMFVIPPEMYDFQARAKRSAYVSLVHIPLNMAAIPQWINNLGTLSVFPQSMSLPLLQTVVMPDFLGYETIPEAGLKKLVGRSSISAASPAYAIRRTRLPGETPIFDNGRYIVYKLN